jgi:hypothetical protein
MTKKKKPAKFKRRRTVRDLPYVGNRHLIIPDTQCKPGVPLNHLLWLGDYIADKQFETIIMLGDWWDMSSLSSYDKGTKKAEGKRYGDDIAAGKLGMDLLHQPIDELNAQRRKQRKTGRRLYKPRKVFLLGNHEERIMRHVNYNPELAGKLGYHDLELERHGWEVHGFLHLAEVDGIAYTHYFPNAMTGKPLGGAPLLRLKQMGFSGTMGHQQGKDSAQRYLANGTSQRLLIAGSFYMHDEDYKGPQGNHHWRGVLVKHEVADGNYDMMEVSLAFLQKRYYHRHPHASREPIVYRAKVQD